MRNWLPPKSLLVIVRWLAVFALLVGAVSLNTSVANACQLEDKTTEPASPDLSLIHI